MLRPAGLWLVSSVWRDESAFDVAANNTILDEEIPQLLFFVFGMSRCFLPLIDMPVKPA
jgi:hypothetical protein